MKKLSTLMAILFLGFGIALAEKVEDDRNRGYSNSFIFTEGGIEFAVFPDGQFDFNYLDNGPQFYGNTNAGNVNISFNTGFNYDPFVQYDQYGAVIQIENTPIFYDPYGRVIQAGNVFINYRNGWVNNIGNLYVRYSRPGVILDYRGYINSYNRFYVYRPWHRFYALPIVDRCIVFGNPYRALYNPIRFSYDYHRNYWNSPSYYNGIYVDNRYRRNFYRPYDNVVYNDYERGNRNSRGIAVATGRRTENYRNEIATGRNAILRTNTEGRIVSNVRSSESRNYTNTNERNSSIGIAGRTVESNDSGRTSNDGMVSRSGRERGNTNNGRNIETSQRSSRFGSTIESGNVQRQAQINDQRSNAGRSGNNRSASIERTVSPRNVESTNNSNRVRNTQQPAQREQVRTQRSSRPTATQQRPARAQVKQNAPSRTESVRTNSSSGRSSSGRSGGRSSGRGE